MRVIQRRKLRIESHHQKVGRGKKGFFPTALRRSMSLPTHWFFTSSLQNCGRINSCCDTTFSLWYFFFWLCWLFVSVWGLSLVAASGGHSSSRCAGLSLSRPHLLQSTGSRRAGSVVVAHGPSCSAARGIFPDQGLNPCPLHWQATGLENKYTYEDIWPANRVLTISRYT